MNEISYLQLSKNQIEKINTSTKNRGIEEIKQLNFYKGADYSTKDNSDGDDTAKTDTMSADKVHNIKFL